MMEDVRGKVLLIDDDPLFLRLLGDTFSEAGFGVVTAPDGVQGIKAFLDHAPDVVISDLLMPRMGGVSACVEIARASGEKKPLIILMTSMLHEPPHEHDPPEMGARVHISKNTPLLNVVIIVEQLLERDRSAAGPA